MKKLVLFAMLVALTACKTYSEDDKTSFDQKISSYLKKSKVKYQKSESGLYYYIENVGEGENIKLTDEVSFCYEGRLLNREVFDGENKRKPITYKVNKLIMAWQEGMMYIKKGGKMKLISPPQLGYGDQELDDIPKNSILLFDIEVKEVK